MNQNDLLFRLSTLTVEKIFTFVNDLLTVFCYAPRSYGKHNNNKKNNIHTLIFIMIYML